MRYLTAVEVGDPEVPISVDGHTVHNAGQVVVAVLEYQRRVGWGTVQYQLGEQFSIRWGRVLYQLGNSSVSNWGTVIYQWGTVQYTLGEMAYISRGNSSMRDGEQFIISWENNLVSVGGTIEY